MNDGDVVHSWKSGKERLCALKEGSQIQLACYRHDVPIGAMMLARRDAEQLLVAFDKMEQAQNKQHGPLSVELAGLPGRYLPGLDGQPVRVDDATDKMEGRG